MPEEYLICFIILAFIFGLVVGSFLNVCIYRIPEGGDIVKEPSHCMSCGKRLAWYDMFPVVSWLLLRGKCRQCGAKISAQYPFVELLNAALWAATIWICGADILSCIYCFVISCLIVLAFIDARTMEIPPVLNILIFAAGAVYTCFDTAALVSHIAGLFAVSVPLFVIFAASNGRAIGGGDIKLMAGAGLLLGAGSAVIALIAGCFAGSVIHIARMKLSGAEKVLAMGPYLAAGILLAMWFGKGIITWYMQSMGL